ncbi:MAG: DUF192 domain-containing protein [Phycisphaerales bacterium]
MAQTLTLLRHPITALACSVALAAPLAGCTEDSTFADTGLVRVDITDDQGEVHTFFLEPALDNPTRVQGLSGRTEIADDGGMIFIFPRPQVQRFVMRDCPIPIDIVYLDNEGRVVAHHAMLPEAPRGEDESEREYEERLTRYSSRFSVPTVIELQGGMNESLGIDEGDVIKIYDYDQLRAIAK